MKGLKISGEKHTFSYTFDEEQYGQILVFMSFIKKHSDLGNRIPARLIYNFFSLFDDSNQIFNDLSKVYEICSKTINRFKNDEDYNFTARVKILEDEIGFSESPTKSEIISFEAMTCIAIWKCQNIENDIRIDSINRKSVMMEMLYHYFTSYISRLPKKKREQHLQTYRIYSLIAFIMQEFSYKFTPKSNPTNYQLFQGINYSLNKISKKEKSEK